MTQRNIELQLQALDMIERKRHASCGSVTVEEPDDGEASVVAVEAVPEQVEEGIEEEGIKETAEASDTELQENDENAETGEVKEAVEVIEAVESERSLQCEEEGLDEVIHENVK